MLQGTPYLGPWKIGSVLKSQKGTSVFKIRSALGHPFVFKYISGIQIKGNTVCPEIYYQFRAAEASVGPRIFQINEYPDGIALIMEAYDITLREHINKTGSISRDDIMKPIRKLAKLGIVHNDLHQGNMMRCRSDPKRWFIIDYGRACMTAKMTEVDILRFSWQQLRLSQ